MLHQCLAQKRQEALPPGASFRQPTHSTLAGVRKPCSRSEASGSALERTSLWPNSPTVMPLRTWVTVNRREVTALLEPHIYQPIKRQGAFWPTDWGCELSSLQNQCSRLDVCNFRVPLRHSTADLWAAEGIWVLTTHAVKNPHVTLDSPKT